MARLDRFTGWITHLWVYTSNNQLLTYKRSKVIKKVWESWKWSNDFATWPRGLPETLETSEPSLRLGSELWVIWPDSILWPVRRKLSWALRAISWPSGPYKGPPGHQYWLQGFIQQFISESVWKNWKFHLKKLDIPFEKIGKKGKNRPLGQVTWPRDMLDESLQWVGQWMYFSINTQTNHLFVCPAKYKIYPPVRGGEPMPKKKWGGV